MSSPTPASGTPGGAADGSGYPAPDPARRVAGAPPEAAGPGAGEPAADEPIGAVPDAGEYDAAAPGAGEYGTEVPGAGERGDAASGAGEYGAEVPGAGEQAAGEQPADGTARTQGADRGVMPRRTESSAPLTPDGIEKLLRNRQGAVLGGVCGGIASHLNIPVVWVRAMFALLGVMAGAGLVAYALLWIFVPQRPPGSEAPLPTSLNERRQAIGIAAIGIALVIVGAAMGFSSAVGWVLGPLGLAAVGAAFIWREADDTRRARWKRSAAGIVTPQSGTWWRLGGGIALVVGGLTVFALGQFEFSAVRSALIAVLLTLVGVGLITIPWWLRLIRALGEERRERVVEAERAEVAAHLHDSVLQTLALIQRQAGDAREVQRLARGQERELRTWLYGPTGYAGGGPGVAKDETLAAALATAAGEVEDTYAMQVTPVVVGDAEVNPGIAALVAATKEAMVNAAKHSGETEVSVYAEVEEGTVSVFIRDRGKGFDPAAVGADRRGVAQSIRGRMDRHGGTATIRSTPGEGTEVVLTMPVEAGESKVDITKRPASGNAGNGLGDAGNGAGDTGDRGAGNTADRRGADSDTGAGR